MDFMGVGDAEVGVLLNALQVCFALYVHSAAVVLSHLSHIECACLYCDVIMSDITMLHRNIALCAIWIWKATIFKSCRMGL